MSRERLRTDEGDWPERGANRTFLLVVLTATGATTFTSVLMVAPLLIDLAAEFQTTVAVVGQLVTAGALVWAALAPFCGALSDRYGRRPLLLTGLTVVVGSTVLSSWAPDLATLFTGRILMCIGGALVATNLQTSIADHFPLEQRGRALGWVNTGFSLSPLLGVPLVAFVTEGSDWRWAFRVVATIELVIVVLVYRALPSTRPAGSGSYGKTFAALLRSPAVLGLLSSNIFERIAYGAVTTYLAAFLMQSYGLTVGQAAPVISLVAVGTLAGTMAGGRLAGRTDPAKLFMLAQGVAALTLLPLMAVAAAVWLSALIAGSFGASNALSRPSYMLLVTQVALRVRGAMMGLNIMTNQLGLVFGGALGGLAIAVAGYGELGVLASVSALLAVLSCRMLVRPGQLATVGLELGRIEKGAEASGSA